MPNYFSSELRFIAAGLWSFYYANNEIEVAVLSRVIKIFVMSYKNQKSGGGLGRNTDEYSTCSRLHRANWSTAHRREVNCLSRMPEPCKKQCWKIVKCIINLFSWQKRVKKRLEILLQWAIVIKMLSMLPHMHFCSIFCLLQIKA